MNERLLWAAAVCGAVWAGTVDAEELQLRSQRGLDGHVFQPTVLVRTPFTLTVFEVGLGYGFGEATGPTYGLSGGEVVVDGERTYSFAAMGQTFAYEYKFADWFSAGGGLLTTLYSGTDSASALVVGADVTIGAFGRATASRRLGPVQAALTLDVSYGPRLGIVVIDAVKQSIATGDPGAGSPLQLSHIVTLQPGAAVAWALNPAFGLQASVDYQWLHLPADSGDTSASALGLAVAADLDLAKLTKVPMGVLAAIHWVEPLTGEGTISRTQDYSVGGFYTARPDVVLGAEVGWRKFEIRPPLASSETLLQVRASYYW